MKTLTILGSTGSIGCNTLEIIKMHPEQFEVKALAGGSNVALLAEQIKAFRPSIAVVLSEAHACDLESRIENPRDIKIVYGEEGYSYAAAINDVDMVVSAMVGAAGLMPTLAAIDSGKDVALANKETLVIAGDIVMKKAASKGARILPVDSEHSAIFQCLAGHSIQDVTKIFLTASGGPFLNVSREEFREIQPGRALNHPTWQMGDKISIDSATLMNKGLEVIEATHLFGIAAEHIDVLVHPQSIVHSMVAFNDGSVLAQLGIPDMKAAIAYAISYPERLPIQQPLPDFTDIGSLTFQPPDVDKFPCLSLAFKASEAGGTLPAVLNAANEVAVQAFLKKKIAFDAIPVIIKQTMSQHTVTASPVLSDILDADKWARKAAKYQIEKISL